MKRRKMIQAIQGAPNHIKRWLIAADVNPESTALSQWLDSIGGTVFARNLLDRTKHQWLGTMKERREEETVYRQSMIEIGEIFADLICEKDHKFFTRIAGALKLASEHRPQPDLLRMAVFRAIGHRHERLARWEDVVAHVSKTGFDISEASVQKQIRRIASEAGVRLTGRRGRPRKSDTTHP